MWTVDSLTLAPETLRARISDVRLFSVDGGHAYKNVLHDMRLAEAVLADDGVMIVHDFFGIGWPDVSVAVIHLLTEMKNLLQPFLITQYKLFVARPAAAEHYRAMLGTNPRLRGNRCFQATVDHGMSWARLLAG